jgi:hypothetical protein
VDTAIAYMEEGAIAITVRTSPQSDVAWVWIDIESSREIWQEPIDLLKEKPLDVDLKTVQSLLQAPVPSPGMNLLLSQCLLETMGGGLEILQTPSPSQEKPFTRVQCSIPLASAQMIEEAQLID